MIYFNFSRFVKKFQILILALCTTAGHAQADEKWVDQDGNEREIPRYPYFFTAGGGVQFRKLKDSNLTVPPSFLGEAQGIEMWANHPLSSSWKIKLGKDWDFDAQLMMNLSTQHSQRSGWYGGMAASLKDAPFNRSGNVGVAFGYMSDSNTYIWFRPSIERTYVHQKQVANGVNSRMLDSGNNQAALCLDFSQVMVDGEETPKMTLFGSLDYGWKTDWLNANNPAGFKVDANYVDAEFGILATITPQIMGRVTYSFYHYGAHLGFKIPTAPYWAEEQASSNCQQIQFTILANATSLVTKKVAPWFRKKIHPYSESQTHKKKSDQIEPF